MNPSHPTPGNAVAATRWLAAGSLLALIALCLAWELVLAPLRPGGSWLALKALPLCIPCLLYTSPSPRDKRQSRMPSSA